MTKHDLIAFEDSLKDLWEQGKIHNPHHFCGGNEDELIEYFQNHVHHGDWVFSTHRNAYHWLLKTKDKDFLYNQILNKNNSMHIIDLERKFISTGIVAGGCGPATGTALAIKLREGREHVHCFIGDGATDQGWFWEALRYAQCQDLPITFIIEDNNRCVETTKKQRWGVANWSFYLEPKVFYYSYDPTYPHCGTGRYVKFM